MAKTKVSRLGEYTPLLLESHSTNREEKDKSRNNAIGHTSTCHQIPEFPSDRYPNLYVKESTT